MNALTYLQASRPYQVKPVGYSLVELGYISTEDVESCASTPATAHKAKVNSDAGALFSSSLGKGRYTASTEDYVSGDSDLVGCVTVERENGVGETVQHACVDSDGAMSEVEEDAAASL